MSLAPPPKPKRRWYQFRVRTLLIVVLAVPSGCGPSKEQQAIDAHSRGIAHYHKGELDKAIADFTEVIRINPEFADAYINRGVAYRHNGDQAKADFAKAKEFGYEPE